MNELIQFLDYNFALICRCCNSKVLDPDKKRGQMYLKGKCPSCGQLSQEVKKSKKERKREKRLQRQLKKAAMMAQSNA